MVLRLTFVRDELSREAWGRHPEVGCVSWTDLAGNRLLKEVWKDDQPHLVICGWRTGYMGPKTIFKVPARGNLEKERCKGQALRPWRLQRGRFHPESSGEAWWGVEKRDM